MLGVDLGSSYSRVAYVDEQGDPRVIPDAFARTSTSSALLIRDGRVAVGDEALNRWAIDPVRVTRWFKPRIGDADFQFQGMSAVELSAEILKALKANAEHYLGQPVEEAVITCPAYFAAGEIENTKRAGELAGFQVREIVPDPVAAAWFCYAHDTRDPLRIMTYDLGGTFDVAFLEKRDGRIRILSIDGDRYVGGFSFDRLLAGWIVDQLNRQGYDLRWPEPLRGIRRQVVDQRTGHTCCLTDLEESPNNAIFWAKLMVYAEQAKMRLSKFQAAMILEPAGVVDHAGNLVDIDLEITRCEFEDLIKEEVERTILLCRRAMSRAYGDSSDIPLAVRRAWGQLDEIMMVGGSSSVPLVRRRLEEEFGAPPECVEPYLCVALGAAMIAGTYRRIHPCA